MKISDRLIATDSLLKIRLKHLHSFIKKFDIKLTLMGFRLFTTHTSSKCPNYFSNNKYLVSINNLFTFEYKFVNRTRINKIYNSISILRIKKGNKKES